ncbi:AHH domain-containing protein [Psychrobacillus sp. FSL K6-2684]|uniref:AHH domain-containing protein n=1 Tax=Psychrobacillus TaxID=1221880 RepID=UPI001C92DECF|nr:AHH domain-containing protein [Psychrobacillus faecigallinarum]
MFFDIPKGTGKPKKEKPKQVHHYATNKSKTYTHQLENVKKKYGLELDDAWNKELLPPQGRDPNAYHEYVLDRINEYDAIARGNKEIFLELFEGLKKEVRENPDMLYKEYWLN